MATKQPTQAEENARRKSAPRPTATSEVMGMAVNAPQMPTDAFNVLNAPIDTKFVQKATETLQKYKDGKANLERRIVDNERWYNLRHWECLRNKDGNKQPDPVSAWMFNSIQNKHADAMDNFPSPNILPREEADEFEAEQLSSILPVILDHNDFEQTYDEVMSYKLKFGTGIYGIFWDKAKLNGLGDIAIKKIDLLNIFTEPGIADIQNSRNIFTVELIDNDILESKYPQLVGKLSSPTITVTNYVYDDTVDTTNKSVVVDMYYKKYNSQGKQVLHYVKYCNDIVLYATENTPELKEVGLYEHGKYPFIFDPLFRTEGMPTGFGYIDVGKSAQEYIDRGNKAILANMLVNSKPRHFVREDGSVNEAEYADLDNDFIHVDGNLGDDSIRPVPVQPLSSVYVEVLRDKIDELKETTGNRDISTGGTTSGVTAASAIAAMQEAGSKLSRDSNKASYRAFRQITLMIIELIRQFYDMPRMFRITGANGIRKYISYSNERLIAQAQGTDFGEDLGIRLPIFDVEITAQKQSPYSKMSQNELALQFYSAGFFNPQMATQALACLEMMDFDRKDAIMQRIGENGSLYDQIVALQQQMMGLGGIVDSMRGGNEVTASLANQFGMQMPQNVANTEALGGSAGTDEAENTKKARQRVADSTAPN